MIIKSMARKAPTFRQLVDYIGRDASSERSVVFARNLYHGGHDSQLVADQFYQNHHWLPERKNGNALYHEVIVLEPQAHLPKNRVSEILVALAEDYCKRRAPEQLAWGRVHLNTDYPHIHLMLSANAVRSDKRVRLEKTSFAQIQCDLERYKFEHFPELHGVPIYAAEHDKQTPKITRHEGESTRRTGKVSSKQMVFLEVLPVFKNASDTADLQQGLSTLGYAFYQRGKTAGIQQLSTGKKYRIKTLGLQAELERVSKSNKQQDDRAQELLRTKHQLEKAAKKQLTDFDRRHEGLER